MLFPPLINKNFTHGENQFLPLLIHQLFHSLLTFLLEEETGSEQT